MEDIVKNFLEEIEDIEKSSLFMEDDSDEPTTEWVEEIDPRTNFPFYWNSTTKESVWDKPESYEEYLVDYERYLKNVMDIQCIERAREQHEVNMKKRSDMRGLLGYSDSEDESPREDIVKEEVKVIEETSVSEDCAPEESVASKKERWMLEQMTIAKQYLHNLVKEMSETALKKMELFPKDIPNNETLIPLALRIQTRLEDWEGGHLTLERTVDKLQEALISLSKLEGDLESVNWKLQWDKESMRYYSVNTVTGKKKLTFPCNRGNYEDGEIVDDEEDLTSDLHEYVISTLHRSLQDDATLDLEESQNDASKLESVNDEVPLVTVTRATSPLPIVDNDQEIVKDDSKIVEKPNENLQEIEIKDETLMEDHEEKRPIEEDIVGVINTDENISEIREDVEEDNVMEDGEIGFMEAEEGQSMIDGSEDYRNIVQVEETSAYSTMENDVEMSADENDDLVVVLEEEDNESTEDSNMADNRALLEVENSRESTIDEIEEGIIERPEVMTTVDEEDVKEERIETLNETISSDQVKLVSLVNYLDDDDDMSDDEERTINEGQ